MTRHKLPTLPFALVCLARLLSPLNSEASGLAEAVGSAEVRTDTGTPILYVNGRPHNPLMYFGGPHRITSAKDGGAASPMTAEEWRAKRPGTLHTFELAARHGVHLHSFDVWMPWAKPGQEADYGDTERAIAAVLARDPQGFLLLRFTMDPPLWWREAHPDQMMQWQGPGGLTTQLMERDYPQMATAVSVASDVWRTEAGGQLSRFIKHLEARYGNHILGYHFAGQNTHEWFLLGSRGDKLNCCEPVFTAAWRRWLREKYGSDNALRAAWGDPAVMFATAAPPTYDERLHATLEYFRDPAHERKTMDFHEYQNVAVAEALEHFAHIVKRDSRKLAVCFYGYLFEHGTVPHGVQQSGHLALGRLLKCPDIDVICAPMSYSGGLRGYESRMPGGIGAFMTTVDSVALHGKLWYNEDDTRTHLSIEANRKPLASLEETRNVHRRNFAHLFVRGMSCWWMDLHGQAAWLDDDGIWQNLGALAKYYGASFAEGARFAPEIAVIADEKSCYALTQGRQPVARHLMFGIRDPLYRIGAPSGYYLLEDLVAGRVPPKKLYVFVNCFALTEADRAGIAKQCAGKTCVFMYANGLIDETVAAQNMEKLLGVPLVLSREKISGQCQPVAHPLTKDVSLFGVDELTPVITLDGRRDAADKTEILANYAVNGQPAAWKHTDQFTAIYIGALAVPVALLRNIAIDAGVHVYSDGNDVIEANEHFFAIHAGDTGEKVIHLPRPARVREALSGVAVGDGIMKWSVPIKKGDTRLYSIDYAKTGRGK